jgi:hypothetical protein
MNPNKIINNVINKKMDKYICGDCNRIFKRKTNYDAHIIICEQLSDSKMMNMMLVDENDGNLPTKQEMFYLLRNLIKKCSILESEVDNLKKFANITKKQINALDWLNNNLTCSIDFKEWLNNITISQKQLHSLFALGYIDGIYHILENVLPLTEITQHPIKCFNQNKNVFFVYQDNKWSHMSLSEFKNMSNILNNKVIKAFYVWKKEHIEEIEKSDAAHDKYTENMRIVLGENKSPEEIIQKLKGKLYSYLKCDLKNIIKYEFTF